MTRLFDGMAGLLTSVFGGPVVYMQQGVADVTIEAVLREKPTAYVDDEGREILITAPTLRVPKGQAPNIARGDRVAPADNPGDVFFVLNVLTSGSPANDGMIICQLEKVLNAPLP